MSGKRSGIGSYQGGWSQDKGRYAIGNSDSGATAKHKVLCSALGNHVYGYGQKASSDKMGTTW